MDILTIDFETFYDQKFSLSKMTTEEYIRDPRFETIGVSVKRNDEPAVWFSGTKAQTKQWLDKFLWHSSVAVAHNAMFDMAILNWQFDIRPKRIVDTLSMLRAIDGPDAGNSLAKAAIRYGLGLKGTEVLDALGKRRVHFTPEELSRYGVYCCNDGDLTYDLFKALVPSFPIVELNLVDLTIRMFTEPVLGLDGLAMTKHLHSVREKKARLLEKALVDKKQIMSNAKLAQLLTMLGVVPPTKISPKTGKEAFAFAKSDEGFKALLEHPNPIVQSLVSARLGVKSTLEETRTERFIAIANRGTLPVPLRYYGAHTGRWSGEDKINLQNLPRGSALKKAILAPKGTVYIDCDSSQIEARTLAWLAGQNDLVEAFDKGEDVYKIMASSIYGVPLEEVTKDQRFVGKTTILGCLAEGTLVLTDRGRVAIEEVALADKLWDGEEWVCHQGLVKKGIKQTLSVCGLWLTPDHKILCGTQWVEAQSVAQDKKTLSQALDTGARGLPRRQITTPTAGKSASYSRNLMTYDIAYAGPRNRYTVSTDAGPLIVHNCGYGMGALKFRAQVRAMGVDLPLEECERIIFVYRATYPKIPLLWKQAQDALNDMTRGFTATLGVGEAADALMVAGHDGIKLPNGLWMRYKNLGWVKTEQGKREMVYDTQKGKAVIPTRIYGGKLVENICQALARIIIGEQMLMVSRKLRVVLTVHDAVGALAPEDKAVEARRFVEDCMRIRPKWATALPLNCESKMGASYGG